MQLEHLQEPVDLRLRVAFTVWFRLSLRHEDFHLDLLLALLDTSIGEEALKIRSRLELLKLSCESLLATCDRLKNQFLWGRIQA